MCMQCVRAPQEGPERVCRGHAYPRWGLPCVHVRAPPALFLQRMCSSLPEYVGLPAPASAVCVLLGPASGFRPFRFQLSCPRSVDAAL